MKLATTNKKTNICILIVAIVFVVICCGVCYGIYSKKEEIYYVKYDEYSNLDYDVALKENEYYEQNHLGKDRQYIASLIDHINADFKYELNVKDDIEYQYKYRIVANVNVIDNDTNRIIYDKSENMLEEITGKNRNPLEILESVKIDYNKYNDMISDFVTDYKLRDVTNKLTVKMFVAIAGIGEEFTKEESVISIDIPLTTNTVGIDVNYNLSNNVDKLITLKSSYNNSKVLLYVARGLVVVAIGLTIGLVAYMRTATTEQEQYNNELKKIINNYGTYISEVEDEFDMRGYQILRVKKFVDLLEIRDTMHIPIIMIENKESLATCFMVPTANKILYFYSLGVTQYALPTKASQKAGEAV